uniref:Uncharacterized protein n=1 Tax=Sphaerodactylus townsendi TaxID=933632 RepID=A0ACB8E852_9SAUR
MINILDAKRSMNIGIFLKQFKKSFGSIIEDLHSGKSDLYSSETLRELLKLLPETEEVKKLKDFNGDISKLCQADSFMYLLIQVPNYSLRIEAMMLKKEFSPSCSSLQKDMTIIRRATKELMCCEELHSILHLVLQAGNIMNAEAQKKDKVLLTFSEKLQHVQEAARIPLDNLEAELNSLSSKTKSLKENIRKDSELYRQMEGFFQFAVKEIKELEQWKRDLLKEANALMDFLCEDKETVKLEDCFQIFRDFCLRFNKAVKENKERETHELQQRQRLKEREEKRLSWVVGDLGALGRSSSESDVGTLTRRGLEDFLPFLQQRPQSPAYRNASIRRSRHSLGITADRELLAFLEISKDEEPLKSSSLPSAQARPSVAWSESEQSREHRLTNSHRTSGEGMGCNYVQSPPPQSGLIEDIEELDTANEQDSVDSDKYGFSVPSMEATATAPWDLSVEEHELVTGLIKFDLNGANATEDPSTVHFEIGGTNVKTLGDSGFHSVGITGDPVPSSRTSRETVHKVEHEAPELSDSPTSTDSSVSGNKVHGPVFCMSDTDYSLALDLSEGNDAKLDGNKIKKEDGAMALFMNDLQTGGRSLLGVNSSFPDDKEDTSSKLGHPKEKHVKNKDASGPKRNSLKEKSPSSTKSSSGPPNHPRPVRTLNVSENANMRKVVPISRSTKTPPPTCTKKPEAKPAPRDTTVTETRLSRRNSVRGAETVPKPLYRQSISVEEPKFQRGTSCSSSGHFEREQLQHKGSFKKPSSKPVRCIPKSKNDETKMCRSSTKPQSPTDPNKSPVVIVPKTPAPVPSFARNTVASSSRCAKVELPGSSRPPTLTRSLSQRLPKMRVATASDEFNPRENSGSPLKRANSARMIKHCTDTVDHLRVKMESMLRDDTNMEKSAIKEGNQTAIGKFLNRF